MFASVSLDFNWLIFQVNLQLNIARFFEWIHFNWLIFQVNLQQLHNMHIK